MSQTESLPPLTSEQTATAETLRLLLGTAVANRYLDFWQLVSGELPLQTTRPLAAHALRELEALVRAVLAAPMDAVLVESPDAKAERGAGDCDYLEVHIFMQGMQQFQLPGNPLKDARGAVWCG